MNKNLTKIFELCVKISEETKCDVFFNYYPHINTIEIYYHLNGWKANEDGVRLHGSCGFDLDNKKMVKNVLTEMKDLYKKAKGVSANVDM